jgi:hypothetical protein
VVGLRNLEIVCIAQGADTEFLSKDIIDMTALYLDTMSRRSDDQLAILKTLLRYANPVILVEPETKRYNAVHTIAKSTTAVFAPIIEGNSRLLLLIQLLLVRCSVPEPIWLDALWKPSDTTFV